MSEFKTGDMVRDRGGEEFTIEFGPYDSELGPSYLVKDAAGNCYPCTAVFLSAVPPEDPRVEAARESLFAVVADPNRRDLYARTVLAALDAMPQEKPSPRRVRDRDGDVWEETDGGTWIGVTFPADVFGSHRELAEEWGPLTDV